jgi:uncharacterized protein (TIGR03083 family)
MARLRQYYGSPGLPLEIEADPQDPVTAWHSQRTRLHTWLGALDDADWDGPTRCDGWDVTMLVRHLGSATQFLGYTLAEASQGTATTLLEGMDTRTTVASAAELMGDRTPAEARTFLAGLDRSVESTLDRLGPDGLSAVAEAPPGHVPVHLAVSHFLFDSWVHEYDLLVPRDEVPVLDPLEARVVVAYLCGLASLAPAVDGVPVAPVPLEVRVDDLDLRLSVEDRSGTRAVAMGPATPGAAVVEGRAADIVDRLTGRDGGPVAGDPAGLAVLDRFALVLST